MRVVIEGGNLPGRRCEVGEGYDNVHVLRPPGIDWSAV